LPFPDGTSFENSDFVIHRNQTQIALIEEKGIPHNRFLSKKQRLRVFEINELITIRYQIKL
jgi:hypothetical protein